MVVDVLVELVTIIAMANMAPATLAPRRARSPASRLPALPAPDPAGNLSLMTVLWPHEGLAGVQRRRVAR